MIVLRLSLFGMYEYDNTILDDIVLPETINKQVLIDRILQDWGGYNCRFSNPALCKKFVHSWFKANEYNFEMMQKALTTEYNPIENYDRWAGHTITTTRDNVHTSQDSGKDSVESDTTNKQAPFDSNSLKTTNETINNGSTTYGRQNKLSMDDSEKEILDEHVHGNIGVTTNQQMIQSELDLREFDIYQNISDRFANQFVYLNS